MMRPLTALLPFAVPSMVLAGSPIAQPPMNLGMTSLLDGEAGPGGLIELIGNGCSATTAHDAAGHALPGSNGQSTAALLLHPAYVSAIPVLGGHLGFELLLPFTSLRIEAPGLADTWHSGGGDVTIAPFVQWSGARLLGRPFSMRLGLQGVLPTGSFTDRRRDDRTEPLAGLAVLRTDLARLSTGGSSAAA